MNAVRQLPKKIFKVNPIIVKEVRSRMRGPRAFITLTAMLLFMGGIMYAVLQIILAQARYTNVLSPQIGQTMFAALSFLMLFMICAVTPAVTSSAISSEKEKQTYEMLMATPLSGSSILWGKLISALSYVFLLLFAGVPLASLVFIFGGVSPGDMVRVLIVLLVVAITLGILGLFMSAVFGRTGRSTIASYVVVLALLFGPLFLAVLIAAITQGEPPRWLLAPSPISTLSAALASSLGSFSGRELFFVLSGVFNAGIDPISQTSIPRPLYHYSLPLYVVLSTALYLLSTRMVQPAHRWQMRAKEIVFGLGILLVLLALITAGFLLTASRYEWALRQSQPPAQLFTEPAIAPPPQQTAVVTALNVDEENTADIYAAIARQFYTVDHTFGDKAPMWPNLYLVSRTDDSVGDPDAQQGNPADLPNSITEQVTEKLQDLPATITWVTSRDDVATSSEDGSLDGGQSALITFGNVYLQDDGTARVSASLYFSSLGATGKTYILVNENGVWKITGTTGVEWIS